MKYSFNPPGIIKACFSKFYWHTTNGKVLLTFDDGPLEKNTQFILDELKKINAKALFFCVGENINKYPEVAKEIFNQGHTIGNHTYNHKRITKLGKSEITEQIDLVTEILKEKLDYNNLFFRPPYGRFNISLSGILQEKNLKNIMWSLLTYDYKNRLDIVKFGVRKYLRNDSIIVLHDSLKSKDIIIDSIRYITDEVLKKGFVFGEPEECLK